MSGWGRPVSDFPGWIRYFLGPSVPGFSPHLAITPMAGDRGGCSTSSPLLLLTPGSQRSDPKSRTSEGRAGDARPISSHSTPRTWVPGSPASHVQGEQRWGWGLSLARVGSAGEPGSATRSCRPPTWPRPTAREEGVLRVIAWVAGGSAA